MWRIKTGNATIDDDPLLEVSPFPYQIVIEKNFLCIVFVLSVSNQSVIYYITLLLLCFKYIFIIKQPHLFSRILQEMYRKPINR